MRDFMKINLNWYAVDSVEVVEIKKTGLKDGFAIYEVNIHTKSGKSFTAHEDHSLEEAIDYRNDIIKTMAGKNNT